MIELGEVGKFLVKIGGIIALVLGIVNALKYAAYLLLLYLAKGVLDALIAALGSSLSWISMITNLMASLGSVAFIALLVLSIVFAYLGFRIFKAADELPMPAKARDKWIIALSILFALSLLLGSPFLAASFLLPIVGLIIAPIKRESGAVPAPQAQSVK